MAIISRIGGGRRVPSAYTRRGHTTTTTKVVRGGRSQESVRGGRGPNVGKSKKPGQNLRNPPRPQNLRARARSRGRTRG